jgi:Holliday junction resolvase RusA-like endonuclease
MKTRPTRPAPITWSTARCEATATGYHFVLPIPERTNAMWRQWKGRTLSSAKHRADKATAPGRFGRLEPFRGDVAVRLVWVRQRRAGDVDSRVKAALDLLTVIGVWMDDAQVADLQVLRVDDPDKAPGLYVWVWAADEPEVAA